MYPQAIMIIRNQRDIWSDHDTWTFASQVDPEPRFTPSCGNYWAYHASYVSPTTSSWRRCRPI